MSVSAYGDNPLSPEELEEYIIDNAQAIVDAREDRIALQRHIQQLQEEKQQLKATVEQLVTRLDQLIPTLKGYADTKASQAKQAANDARNRAIQAQKRIAELEKENQAQQADIQRLTAENKTLKRQLQQVQQVLNTKVERYYEVIPGSFSWHEARADAEKRGGHLATITSEAEWFFIKKRLGDSLPNVRIWIGATNEGNEGHWRWVTGEPWGYTRWNTGEPNNHRNREHYAHIYGSNFDYRWNDLHNRYPYVTHYLLEK
jgi:predicted nuclease with TOPRIM domain